MMLEEIKRQTDAAVQDTEPPTASHVATIMQRAAKIPLLDITAILMPAVSYSTKWSSKDHTNA
jgi:hypothetical protein